MSIGHWKETSILHQGSTTDLFLLVYRWRNLQVPHNPTSANSIIMRPVNYKPCKDESSKRVWGWEWQWRKNSCFSKFSEYYDLSCHPWMMTFFMWSLKSADICPSYLCRRMKPNVQSWGIVISHWRRKLHFEKQTCVLPRKTHFYILKYWNHFLFLGRFTKFTNLRYVCFCIQY